MASTNIAECVRQWFRDFTDFGWGATLRSALFMACLSAVVGAYGYLDWADAVALKLAPDDAFPREPGADGTVVDSMVLGISSEFFDTELRGHTPINRDRFRELIRAVLASNPGVKVIAIDYDLSPLGQPPCAVESDRSECRIAVIEEEAQARLDAFLSQDLKRELGDRSVALVLISPLSAPEESLPAKRAWQQEMSKAGIRFGGHTLLSHDWFGTVIKQEVAPPGNGCNTNRDSEPCLAAVVNEALAGVTGADEDNRNPQEGSESSLKLMNFGEARKATYFCPVWESDDVVSHCGQRLAAHGSSVAGVETVYIGAAYGQEDQYRTPLGDQYGVEIHAYAAYSLRHPVHAAEEYGLWAVLVDVAIGIFSASIFTILWSFAVSGPRHSIQRAIGITLVFGALVAEAVAAVVAMPAMLNIGWWLNPVLIFLGSFIDSYQGVIDHAGAGADHEQSHVEIDAKTGRSGRDTALCRGLFEFLGVGAEGQQRIRWSDLRNRQCRERNPEGCILGNCCLEECWLIVKRLAIYWGVVAWGVYLTMS